MTEETFARQISSYIDLNTVKNILLAYDKNKQEVLIKSVSLLGSETIKKPQNWDLYNLIKDYLKNFKIAEETIDLILKLEPKNTFSNEAVNWLRNYKFSGELRGKPHLNVDTSALHFDPLICVIAESGIIDILHIPLNFIFNSVETFSETWSKMNDIGARAFLEPSSPSELFVYIEKRVANHYKNLEKTKPGETSGSNIFNGYRYSCITSDIPVDIKLLEVSTASSEFQAKSTTS